jgi:hypothetical protein
MFFHIVYYLHYLNNLEELPYDVTLENSPAR